MLYDKLEYVIAVAEERNLTKAAQRLYVSQPTLSMYLNRLEEELGAKLFDRTKSPITITDAGQFYLQKMKQIALAERTMRRDLQFISNPTQTFVVGIGQYRGNHWLPLILPRFCEMHPDVNIQLVQTAEDVIYEQLQQQQIDLVIGAYPTASRDLIVEELMFEKLYLAASKKLGIIPESIREQYGCDNPYRVRPEQLRGIPFIMSALGHGLYSIYEGIIQENHLMPSRTIGISNLGTGIQLTAAGLGIQLLSGPALDQLPSVREEDLDFFIIKGMPEYRRCVAIYHPDSIKQDMIRDFLQIVRERAIPACTNCVVP